MGISELGKDSWSMREMVAVVTPAAISAGCEAGPKPPGKSIISCSLFSESRD